MKRCYLITMIVALVAMVAPSQAQSFNWSANAVSITQFEGPTGLSSRINAKRVNRPLGGWTSQTGILPVIVAADDMRYDFTLSTAGIFKIEQAILTPDHGKTVWPMTLIDGKGYTTALPIGPTRVRLKCQRKVEKHHWWGSSNDTEEYEDDFTMPGLTPGEMSNIESRVTSRDKHNKLIIVVIPISWDSTRVTCAGSAIMVQTPPLGFCNLPDTQAFAYLRGFLQSWATPDMAVIVAQNMPTLPSTPAPPVQPAPQPAPPAYQPAQQVAPAPLPAPTPPPVSDGTTRVTASAAATTTTTGTTVTASASANVTTTAPAPRIPATVVVWKAGEKQPQPWYNQTVDARWFQNLVAVTKQGGSQFITFKTVTGVYVASTEVTAKIINTKDGPLNIVEFHIYRGSWIAVDNVAYPTEDK